MLLCSITRASRNGAMKSVHSQGILHMIAVIWPLATTSHLGLPRSSIEMSQWIRTEIVLCVSRMTRTGLTSWRGTTWNLICSSSTPIFQKNGAHFSAGPHSNFFVHKPEYQKVGGTWSPFILRLKSCWSLFSISPCDFRGHHPMRFSMLCLLPRR